MRLIDPILAELDQESETTRRILERVANDKLNWKPHNMDDAFLVEQWRLTREDGKS